MQGTAVCIPERAARTQRSMRVSCIRGRAGGSGSGMVLVLEAAVEREGLRAEGWRAGTKRTGCSHHPPGRGDPLPRPCLLSANHNFI